MTRKRFQKLAMSAGASRDEAEGLAWLAQLLRQPYQKAWPIVREALASRPPVPSAALFNATYPQREVRA